MYIALCYTRGEQRTIRTIDDAVGPFDSEAQAWAFADQHWGKLNGDDLDVFELSSPNGYGA